MKKNTKKRKKRRLSVYADEVEEETKPKFPINKDLVFSNNAEIVAKNILEKSMLNAFIEIKLKNIYSLMGIFCSNHLFKEIKTLLSLSHLCYDTENSFLAENNFNDNYLRYEPSWDECNIPQPNSAELDRWKIHHLNIVKTNKTMNIEFIPKLHDKKKSKGINKIVKRKSGLFEDIKINIRKNLTKTQRNIKNYEYLDTNEKAKMQKEALKLFDSFPSFPLDDNLFKRGINITKEEEQQIGTLREEILVKEEIKRKEEEKRKRIELLRHVKKEKDEKKESEEKNKYRGKNIAVTANGEIIFIKSVNVKSLKSEFLQVTSKMNNQIDLSKRPSLHNKTFYKNKINKSKKENEKEIEKEKEIEIEKNKDNQEVDDFFKENNKSRNNEQVIIGGSSFKNFVPEIGVNIKQGKDFKSGGNDFSLKYNKISYEQFEKTLDYFKKTNIENNELLEIKNENENLSTAKSRNNNIIKPNLTMRRNTLYSFNLSNNAKNINKNFEKSSSLPDIYKTNIQQNDINNNANTNNNSINNNDLNIKYSFNNTNYNNSSNYNNNSSNINNSKFILNSTRYIYNHSNMINLIKTSSSFKNVLLNHETKNKIAKNNSHIYTTATNFFLDFNKNYKVLSRPKHNIISLKKKQNYNNDIISVNNLGLTSQENETKDQNKIPFIKIMKKNLDINILRVRSNKNEIYSRKLDVRDRLSFRKIENEIKEYKDMSQRSQYKKSNSVK